MSEQRRDYGAFDNFMRWLGRGLAASARRWWALSWKWRIGTAAGAYVLLMVIASASGGGSDDRQVAAGPDKTATSSETPQATAPTNTPTPTPPTGTPTPVPPTNKPEPTATPTPTPRTSLQVSLGGKGTTQALTGGTITSEITITNNDTLAIRRVVLTLTGYNSLPLISTTPTAQYLNSLGLKALTFNTSIEPGKTVTLRFDFLANKVDVFNNTITPSFTTEDGTSFSGSTLAFTTVVR